MPIPKKPRQVPAKPPPAASPRAAPRSAPDSFVISWANDFDVEEIELKLRQFDVDVRFGPCRGMTRRYRYEQALRHGLCPPPWVQLALNHPAARADAVYDQHIKY